MVFRFFRRLTAPNPPVAQNCFRIHNPYFVLRMPGRVEWKQQQSDCHNEKSSDSWFETLALIFDSIWPVSR